MSAIPEAHGGSIKGGYNIVKDMKKIKANITLHELAQINE